MRTIRAEAYVDCPREGCDGQWIVEGTIYPPERGVGIPSAYPEWERHATATGDHLPECMTLIQTDTIRDGLEAVEDAAIEGAIESHYYREF